MGQIQLRIKTFPLFLVSVQSSVVNNVPKLKMYFFILVRPVDIGRDGHQVCPLDAPSWVEIRSVLNIDL